MLFNTSLLELCKSCDRCVEHMWGYQQRGPFKPITYYDHFISPLGYEVIILPFYTTENSFKILKDCGFTVVFGLDNNEKCVFAYKKEIQKTNLEKKHNIVVMTLFLKERTHELLRFYEYYTRNGVDHFFMYFNGKVDDRPNLPRADNVTYISWDFPYWCVDKHKHSTHNAQIPAMLSFFKKHLPESNFALIVDTDEFLFCDKKTIKEYLGSNINSHLFAQHRWAKIDFGKWEAEYTVDFYNKGKSIINSSKIDIEYVPRVHKSPGAMDCELELFHNRKSVGNRLDLKQRKKIL